MLFMHGQINYQVNICLNQTFYYTSFFSTIHPAHFAQCINNIGWKILLSMNDIFWHIYNYYEKVQFFWMVYVNKYLNSFLFLRKL